MSVFPPNIKSLPEWAQDRLRWLEQREDNMRAEIAELKARLAAAEARAERAVGLLGDARKCVSLVNVNGYYDVWLARCYALLKEVSHEG